MDLKKKASELFEKLKGLVSRVDHRTVITVGAVLVIGVAVLLNLLLVGGEDTGEGGLKPAIDLTELGQAVKDEGDGSQESVQENASASDYFLEMALSREQARDEAMAVLQSVIDSEDAVEQVRTDAMEDICRIAAEIELEANIESLIMAKGFSSCVAVVNGESASVVVSSDGLLPGQVSQISEIVYEQAGVLPTNLNIIEKN